MHLILVAGIALCPFAEKPAGDDLPVVTHDVSDLLKRNTAWAGKAPARGVAARKGEQPIDALVRTLLVSVDPDSWEGLAVGGGTVRVVNGTTIEVRATKARQKAVGEVLKALRRVADVAVVLEVGLYEVPRDYYKKNLEASLDNGPAVLGDGVAEAVRKKGSLARSNKVTVVSGEEVACLSVRTAHLYAARPRENGAADALDIVFDGVTFKALPTVSSDRRTVRVRLAEKATVLLGTRTETVFDPETEKDVPVEVPDLVESTSAAIARADDGEYVVAPVAYRAAELKKRDRVYVLLLRPTIYIEEEEKERKKVP